MKIDFKNINKFQNTFKPHHVKIQKSPATMLSSASSLEALSNYNKFLSFKGKHEIVEFRDLSDEEFEKYKAKIKEKVGKLDNIFFDIYFVSMDKLNIFLVDTLISNPIFYKNISLMHHKGAVVDNIQSPEVAKARLDFLNKIISDENLSNNWDLLAHLMEIVINMQDEDNLSYMSDFLDKFKSDKRLYENSDIKYFLGMILKSLNKYSKKLLDTIIQNDKLCSNKYIISDIYSILADVKTDDALQVKMDFIEKLLNNPKLLENEELQKKAGRLLELIENPCQLRVIDRILSDDKFLNNKDFMAKITTIFAIYKETDETAEYKIDLLNKISDNKPLYTNDNLMKNACDILLPVNNKSNYEAVKEILSDEKFYNDEYFIKHANNCLLSHNGGEHLLYLMADDELTVRQIAYLCYMNNNLDEDIVQKTRVLNKIIGFNTAKTNEPEDTMFLLDYLPIANKSSVDELSKEEKRLILDKFMKAGAELFEISDDLREYFPLMPKNEDEYCLIISKLVKSLKTGRNFNSETKENIEKCLLKIAEKSSKPNEEEINYLASVFPELKKDDNTENLRKNIQDIIKNPQFKELNSSDKKVLLYASLFLNAGYDSISAFYDSCGLDDKERIKVCNLIKNKNWIEELLSSHSYDSTALIAYKFGFDNVFDLACILYNDKIQESRNDGSTINMWIKRIKKDIMDLKKNQPLLPVTKFPSSDRINQAITEVHDDGSTNLKGIYKDKDGLIVINFNQVENSSWEKIGFKRGTISKGIKSKGYREEFNTGNIKFFVHGLDSAIQLVNFEAFNMPNSDALLSVSYAERPESKFRFFKTQGVILDIDTENIHTGGESDSGTGYKKTLEKSFCTILEDRRYRSFVLNSKDMFKKDEYRKFVEENRNKQFVDIYPVEFRNKLINLFALYNSRTRHGEREYNEFLITNPKPPMAVYAYSYDKDETIDNPIEFLNRDFIADSEYTSSICIKKDTVYNRTKFLREYALAHNIPFVVFSK